MNYSILLLPAILYGYYRFARPTMTLYHASWCSHCKTILPEWNQFAYPGVTIRSVEQSVNFERKVSAFPTWVYSDANGSEIYSGPRTSDGWRAFLDLKRK